jgi:hypothetical protein
VYIIASHICPFQGSFEDVEFPIRIFDVDPVPALPAMLDVPFKYAIEVVVLN